jgi:PAS domain S-box-containing protein
MIQWVVMDIREKTLAGLIALFVIVTVVLFFLSTTIFLDSYRAIESRGVTDNMAIILSNIHDEFTNLEASVSDWGPWDDMYAFALGENPAFVRDNLAQSTYDALHLNFIIITNASGSVIYGQSYNFTDHSFSPVPDYLSRKISTDPLLLHPVNTSPTSGFIVFPDSAVLVAASPILHSDLAGPPAGSLIMGRYLDRAEIQSIGLPSKSPPLFTPLIPPGAPSVRVPATEGISTSAMTVFPVSEEIIAGNTTLRDIDGNDALVLSFQESRVYYLQGKQTIASYLIVQLVIMLILGIFIIFQIDRSVLFRLKRIIADTREVSDGTALRIHKAGDDEIAQLAEAMNQMIERLEQSHTDLRDSEEKFRSFVRESADGYMLLGSQGQILEWNRANERITGIARNEALGTPFIEIQIRLLIPEHRTSDYINRVRQASASIIATGNFSHYYQPREIGIVRPDGTRRTIQQIAFPIRISGDLMFGIINRDITDSKLTENALQQARRKLNSLNMVIFQDLRNAIFALEGYHALAEQVIPGEEGRKFLEREDRILKQIDKSLNYAKNYQDLGMSPPRWQDVNQVFLFALSHLDTLMITQTIRLDDLEIFADPLMEKVFLNLLENSFRQGSGVTAISLTYRKPETGLELVLEDNGRGIPAETKETIFEYGYGEGLGLFLVREILSITGMTIREAGIERQGALFIITVPDGMYRFSNERK